MSRSTWILLGIVVLVILWTLAMYNGLVRARETVNAQWAQVETQYQRRTDLIPNLLETVKGAARFEQSTLLAVTEARTRWLDARGGDREGAIAAAGAFDSALGRLIATFENYPQLQAVAAFRDLMAQLEGTENRIAVARRDYNEAVRAYNVLVKTFPRAAVARLFGFVPEPFFEASEGAEAVPQVDFGTTIDVLPAGSPTDLREQILRGAPPAPTQ